MLKYLRTLLWINYVRARYLHAVPLPEIPKGRLKSLCHCPVAVALRTTELVAEVDRDIVLLYDADEIRRRMLYPAYAAATSALPPKRIELKVPKIVRAFIVAFDYRAYPQLIA